MLSPEDSLSVLHMRTHTQTYTNSSEPISLATLRDSDVDHNNYGSSHKN